MLRRIAPIAHQNRWDWRHRVCKRQQDRYRRQSTHARQYADEVAYEHPGERPEQVVGLQRDAEAVPEIEQGLVHG